MPSSAPTSAPAPLQLAFDSPLGALHVAATERGVCGVWFLGQRHAPAQLTGPSAWAEAPQHPLLCQARDQLLDYLNGESTGFDLPLDLSQGTPFQRAVWQALRDIPRGRCLGYGALASQLGRPQAARAVGAAVGRNPVSVIVPCHRVLGADGSLTGYAGGLERKTALLRLEGFARPEQPTRAPQAHRRARAPSPQAPLFGGVGA